MKAKNASREGTIVQPTRGVLPIRELVVQGRIKVDEEDRERIEAYTLEAVKSGIPLAAAEAGACEQRAQDLLGHSGFTVEEAEPV